MDHKVRKERPPISAAFLLPLLLTGLFPTSNQKDLLAIQNAPCHLPKEVIQIVTWCVFHVTVPDRIPQVCPDLPAQPQCRGTALRGRTRRRQLWPRRQWLGPRREQLRPGLKTQSRAPTTQLSREPPRTAPLSLPDPRLPPPMQPVTPPRTCFPCLTRDTVDQVATARIEQNMGTKSTLSLFSNQLFILTDHRPALFH